MAGISPARSARGRYSQAGYVGSYEEQNEKELYIASVQAGSAQDELYDFNRAGYRSVRPWHEAPVPAFEADGVIGTASAPRRTRQATFVDWLSYHAKREKKDVAVCIVLMAAILLMVAAWCQKNAENVHYRNQTDYFKSKTTDMRILNREMQAQLEMAKSGERIRNLAQNELNMLRPERAEHVTIYIQSPDAAQETLQQNEESRMEVLDVLLGLLDVLHIGE